MNMDEDIVKKLRDQEKILKGVREKMFDRMDGLLREAFNAEGFLRLAASLGIDLSQLPKPARQHKESGPYRVLGLESTATDREVKKRYRELLFKYHPDTTKEKGGDRYFKQVVAAYEQIARERGWQ
jgi:preprotein translocase subunit Sec63